MPTLNLFFTLIDSLEKEWKLTHAISLIDLELDVVKNDYYFREMFLEKRELLLDKQRTSITWEKILKE
jgi:hypothetical protein